jgi:hypothetical protein
MTALLYKITVNKFTTIKVVTFYILDLFRYPYSAIKLNILYFRIATKLVLGCRNDKSLYYVICLITVGSNNSPIICVFFLILPTILYFTFLSLSYETGYLILMSYFVAILLVDRYARRSLTLLKVGLLFNKTLINFLKDSPYPNRIYTRKFICNVTYISKIFSRIRRIK